MKRSIPLLAALLLLTGCSSSAGAATVLSVGDGDTITVTGPSGKTKVRMACIDAPETSQKPAGPAARAALKQLLPVGSTVTLQVKTIDKYGRTVAEVFKPGQTSAVNLQMVASGMAFAYRQYLRECNASQYLGAEQHAKARRLGVWGPQLGYDLMFPWDYRKCRRSGDCR